MIERFGAGAVSDGANSVAIGAALSALRDPNRSFTGLTQMPPKLLRWTTSERRRLRVATRSLTPRKGIVIRLSASAPLCRPIHERDRCSSKRSHRSRRHALLLSRDSRHPNQSCAHARSGRAAVVPAQARDTIAYAGRSRRLAVLSRRARASSNA
jgi:hypothetical protein